VRYDLDFRDCHVIGNLVRARAAKLRAKTVGVTTSATKDRTDEASYLEALADRLDAGEEPIGDDTGRQPIRPTLNGDIIAGPQ